MTRIATDLASQGPKTDSALDVPSDANFERGGNAIIVSPNQLTSPCDGPEGRWENMAQSSNNFVPPWSGTADSLLRPPACFLRDGRLHVELDEAFVRGAVEGFDRMKYVLVVRIARAVAPRLSTEEITTGELETFEMGAIAGDVLLYDVSSAAFLDGAALRVVSDEEVEVVNEGVRGQLASNLVERLGRTVDDLVR
jgi:hypothetical protein